MLCCLTRVWVLRYWAGYVMMELCPYRCHQSCFIPRGGTMKPSHLPVEIVLLVVLLGALAAVYGTTDSASTLAHSPSITFGLGTIAAVATRFTALEELRADTASAARLLARATCPNPYTVRRGDTLAAIAARCGVSLSALASANGLAPRSKVGVGQSLSIPFVSYQRAVPTRVPPRPPARYSSSVP